MHRPPAAGRLLTQLVAVLSVAAAAHTAQAQAPTLIVHGARIFTSDSTQPWAEALAVRGDRIIAVGSSIEIRRLASPATHVIDAAGRTVIPGINDAHAHIGGTPWTTVVPAGTATPPDPTRTEILAAITAAARTAPIARPLEVVIGPNALEDVTLRRAVLDAAAPRHRVMLSVWSGHGVILNASLLRESGIDTMTALPLGGEVERDASGRATGLVHEYAWWSVAQRLQSARPMAELREGHLAFARAALAQGITSVQNMAAAFDVATTFAVACGADTPLRVRLIAMPMTTPHGRTGVAFPERRCPDGSPGRVTVSGVKYVLDGTPVERRAVERQGYKDRPAERGTLNFSPDSLAVFLGEGLARNEQVHVHAVGDSAVHLVLTTMRAIAPAARWRPLRVRIEHGDGLRPGSLALARELGVVLVQNALHLALGPMASARFLPDRLNAYQPLASALRAGIPLALGSDDTPHPFLDIMLASAHPDTPSEAISREEAVRAYTIGAAWAEGTERSKGRLAPGMLADLAILSQDIFTVSAQALPATTAVMTIVAGKVVHDASSAARIP